MASSTETPRSVAIILDGNSRWAAARGLSTSEGHRAGTLALRRTVEAAIELGIESLAVYAFSTENWLRPADEVEDLMEIFGETIDRELPDLAAQGVRTRFIGRRDRAPEWLQQAMATLEEETAARTALAASWPQAPCTAPPGGVELEHSQILGSGVAYGCSPNRGRNRSWKPSEAPPAMSPPM